MLKGVYNSSVSKEQGAKVKTSRERKHLSIALLVGAVVLFSTGVPFSWGQPPASDPPRLLVEDKSGGSRQDQNSAVGELKLEGKHIERLVLSQKDGGTKKFDKPGETIKLPVGEYRLQEVRLQGGYSCRIMTPISDANWVTIAEDKPAVLKVGAPLKQTVEVRRQGSLLLLNYKLLGAGGEAYTSDNRSDPPGFSVYKGDKKIASGKFEYG